MLNLKLQTIAGLINKNDTVIDIGCDHAHLAIYLKKNKLCKEVYASDISENVLRIAEENIKKSKTNIKVYLSDGFSSINNKDINTAVISGMGTNTILNIVNNAPQNITKYIISSNNDYEFLRLSLYKKGFYIAKEIAIKDNNKFYPIMLFMKEFKQETKKTLKYGKSYDKEYLSYLITKEKSILKRIPFKHILKRIKHMKNIRILQSMLKETTKRKRDY